MSLAKTVKSWIRARDAVSALRDDEQALRQEHARMRGERQHVITAKPPRRLDVRDRQ